MFNYSNTLATKLLKKMSWPTDYIFEENDQESIQNAVSISENNAKYLASTGMTKNDIEQGDKGMWMQTVDQNDSGETVLSNYFQKMYSKLSCCLGKKQISVPILTVADKESNKLEKKYIEIAADDCIIDGIDWYDDNTTQASYNEKCQNLLTRLIAFLDKYDPNNEIIDTYGGCLANKHLKENNLGIDFTSKPLLYELADVNRTCLINKCRDSAAYKRMQERQNCETTFCQSEMTFTDLDAANLSILGTQIEQTCGANAAIAQANASATSSASSTSTSTSTDIDEETPDEPETAKKDTDDTDTEQPEETEEKSNNLWWIGGGIGILLIIIIIVIMVVMSRK